MKSMTGYGKGEGNYGGMVITVELKSVNHRFLDLSFKMPRLFNFAEDTLRNYIKSVFTRGHIDIFVNYGAKNSDETNVAVNYSLAENYLALADELSLKYSIQNDITVDKLLAKPNVLMTGELVIDEQEATQALLNAMIVACEGMQSMRATEGENTKVLLLDKVSSICEAAKSVEAFVPTQMENYRDKLTNRVRDALKDIQIDEQKLMNEIVFYTDKVAVDEEFNRLYAHCKHFNELANCSDAVGRQLDFIVQEMNREANTIGSKCNDLSISNYVLQLKTDIEKVREQVQNVE